MKDTIRYSILISLLYLIPSQAAFSKGSTTYNTISLNNPMTLSFYNQTVNGSGFMDMTFSSNSSTGFEVDIYSTHSGYLYLNGMSSSNPARRIQYKIACDSFSSYPYTISAFPATQITQSTTVYSFPYSTQYTYANPDCHFSTTDDLSQKFAGTYSDTLQVSINALATSGA
ncbi:MAG: hypothetical protein CMF51_05515 [Legionellales bacterium]|nr:hypothetical protein [Legionellales bacterium]|tara:strand:+ start:2228 stop:2740 length:513 start_codon:yes stop_codon:yes gene_type:complete